MSAKLPAHVKKTIEVGLTQIEKAITDLETKNSINSLIRSHSRLDRRALFGKTTYLLQSLKRLCGEQGAELIVNMLNRGSSEGAFLLLEEAKSEKVRQFLKTLIVRYGAQYQWLFERFQYDWQRYELTTTYYGIPLVPAISIKIVDKSGKLMELESPLGTYIDLVQALVRHLKAVDEDMEKLGQPKAVRKLIQKDKLESIKKTIDELLETPKEKQQNARESALKAGGEVIG